MFGNGSGMRLMCTAGVAVLAAACAAGSTPEPSASAVASVGASPAESSSPGMGSLVVLADGVQGGLGLWTLDGTKWVQLGPTPDATAIGRGPGGIAIAAGNRLELRSRSELREPGAISTSTWSAAAPSQPIVGLDTSSAGRLALVAADEQGVAYFIGGDGGAMIPLSPAPVQPFAALVRWLDDARLLVLSTDNLQVSRLAVVGTDNHTLSSAASLSGVRAVSASGDGGTVAAATESGVYVGPLAAFQAQTPPAPIANIGDAQVVWALALNATGSQVFLLSGTVAPDGHVTSIHELGYEKQGSGWTQILDSAAPFARAIGQVYLA